MGAVMKWKRGFSRLGIFLGAIVALGISAIGSVFVVEHGNSLNSDYDRFAFLLSANNAKHLMGAASKSAATNTSLICQPIAVV
jgi:hypothetical protein